MGISKSTSSTALLSIDSIRRDGGTQPRAFINFNAAYEYGDEMLAGSKFPPVVAFYDGSDYWLADGFHRAEGAFSAGFDQIECEVKQGTLEDAQWYSFGVNKSHGLRRTNEDKQRALRAALAHPKSASLSDHQIAKHVGVAVSTVGDWRKKTEPTVGNLQSKLRECTDGRTINTANIGRKPSTGAREEFDGVVQVIAPPVEGPGRRSLRVAIDRAYECWSDSELMEVADFVNRLHAARADGESAFSNLVA